MCRIPFKNTTKRKYIRSDSVMYCKDSLKKLSNSSPTKEKKRMT